MTRFLTTNPFNISLEDSPQEKPKNQTNESTIEDSKVQKVQESLEVELIEDSVSQVNGEATNPESIQLNNQEDARDDGNYGNDGESTKHASVNGNEDISATAPVDSSESQIENREIDNVDTLNQETTDGKIEKPKFRFSIDRGGTFTDIYCEISHNGKVFSRVMKLLSSDPSNYKDAPREGIRRIINQYMDTNLLADEIDTSLIDWIRMGTTVATNALLERKGARCALLITKGFGDLLQIGNQSRPAIFDLVIKKPELLYEEVVEIDERIMLVGEFTQSFPEGFRDNYPILDHPSGQKLRVLKVPNERIIRSALENLKQKGIESIAVVLIHSYIYPQHEELIGKIADEIGFNNVSLSSQLMPMIREVPRGHTTCVDAYLTPILREYVRSFSAGFKDSLRGVNVSFMQSDGGLTPADRFSGCKAILSGPAGGVVGYTSTAYDPKTKEPIIGFDMGGTSTDVSRSSGGPDQLEHVYETEIAGVTIQAPQLDISTVAAGGGSRLFFKAGKFVVGPESSGSHPGPVCYRKNGYLSVTDANLFLGRIIPDFFPKIFGPTENEPLDYESTKIAFEALTKEINEFRRSNYNSEKDMTPEEVAFGFIRVANESMCRPIRSLTVSKGYDSRNHVLACFGGAGAQHACAIAENLKMKKVKIHRFAGILSAYGLGMADVVEEAQEPCAALYNEENYSFFKDRINQLTEQVREKLENQGFSTNNIKTIAYLNLRYVGTDYSIMTDTDGDISTFRKVFEDRYQRQYGFRIPDRGVTVDDIRVRGIGKTMNVHQEEIQSQGNKPIIPVTKVRTYFEKGWLETPVYQLDSLGSGAVIVGPCIINQGTSTIVVIPGAIASVTSTGDVEISLEKILEQSTKKFSTGDVDPVQLAIFGHRFMSIAEQMGRTLQRTSISTNIKERLDFSCAIFGPDGKLIANAPHLPVHLGSMSEAVSFQIQHLKDDWKEGEVLIANHPCAGGTHLPDLTVITPCYDYVDAKKTIRKPVFYVASRGHHADIGGISPGSMPPFSKKISEEGVAIVSFKLVKNEVFQMEGISKIFNDAGARNLRDNIADLKAQVAANKQGINLLNNLIEEYSLRVVQAYMKHVQDNATLAVEKMLRTVAEKRGDVLEATDYMDDGSKINLKITINKEEGSAIFDFTGTSAQVYGNTNAPTSITTSAILYCLRCLVTMDIPLNHGCLAKIKIIIPNHSILKPDINCAVVGGNVLTSQRVTDIILKAFKAVAASQGCMNNFIFGNERFGYYETICGGAGAGPSWNGCSAVHTHMTNTRITGVEILEKRYPVLVRQFSIRRGSGGNGKFKGGDGVIREIEFFAPLQVGILSERRVFQPFGLFGGDSGKTGKNLLISKDGTIYNLGGRNSVLVELGDAIKIMTPGGGGFGNAIQSSVEIFSYENDVEQTELGRSAALNDESESSSKKQIQSFNDSFSKTPETPKSKRLLHSSQSSRSPYAVDSFENDSQETPLSPSRSISFWSVDEVYDWMKNEPSISEYATLFKSKNVNGKTLLNLELRQDFIQLGVKSLRDVNTLQKSIFDLRKQKR